MNTPNNAAALERLELISREMRERRVNHGKHTSPTLVAWAARIDAELATLRATLAQPDALTSQPSGEVVAARLTVYADTTAITARIHDVAHCLAPGTYDLYTHPSADAPGVAVDEWLPVESAPKSVADGSRVSGVYLLGFVPDEEIDFDPNACIDIVWWEPLLANKAGTRGKWCRSAGSTVIECKPTHWRPLPAPPAALLHQLAERDAEVERIQATLVRRTDALHAWKSRAEAAERARDEATGLLRGVVEMHTGENIDGCGMSNASLESIAAFLAASGGA